MNPHREVRSTYSVQYYKKFPWKKTYSGIMQRIGNPKAMNYHRYGGRGIKNFLTVKDLEFLWERDNASKMVRPSIDRKDVNGNYSLENCRYVEFNENSRRAFKTHCKKGHKFNIKNTRSQKRGDGYVRRSCKVCQLNHARKLKASKRLRKALGDLDKSYSTPKEE